MNAPSGRFHSRLPGSSSPKLLLARVAFLLAILYGFSLNYGPLTTESRHILAFKQELGTTGKLDDIPHWTGLSNVNISAAKRVGVAGVNLTQRFGGLRGSELFQTETDAANAGIRSGGIEDHDQPAELVSSQMQTGPSGFFDSDSELHFAASCGYRRSSSDRFQHLKELGFGGRIDRFSQAHCCHQMPYFNERQNDGTRIIASAGRVHCRRPVEWRWNYLRRSGMDCIDVRPRPSSTMPWTIRLTLVILWGVCWMFYPPRRGEPPRKQAEDRRRERPSGESSAAALPHHRRGTQIHRGPGQDPRLRQVDVAATRAFLEQFQQRDPLESDRQLIARRGLVDSAQHQALPVSTGSEALHRSTQGAWVSDRHRIGAAAPPSALRSDWGAATSVAALQSSYPGGTARSRRLQASETSPWSDPSTFFEPLSRPVTCAPPPPPSQTLLSPVTHPSSGSGLQQRRGVRRNLPALRTPAYPYFQELGSQDPPQPRAPFEDYHIRSARQHHRTGQAPDQRQDRMAVAPLQHFDRYAYGVPGEFFFDPTQAGSSQSPFNERAAHWQNFSEPQPDMQRANLATLHSLNTNLARELQQSKGMRSGAAISAFTSSGRPQLHVSPADLTYPPSAQTNLTYPVSTTTRSAFSRPQSPWEIESAQHITAPAHSGVSRSWLEDIGSAITSPPFEAMAASDSAQVGISASVSAAAQTEAAPDILYPSRLLTARSSSMPPSGLKPSAEGISPLEVTLGSGAGMRFHAIVPELDQPGQISEYGSLQPTLMFPEGNKRISSSQAQLASWPALADTSDVDDAGHSRAALKRTRRASSVELPRVELPRDRFGRITCDHPECASERPTFARRSEWTKHMDKHTRPYICHEPGCEKIRGFTYSGGLLRHQREVHHHHGGPNVPRFCPHPDCKRHSGQSFSRRENLNEHLRRCHQGVGIENVRSSREPSAAPSDVSDIAHEARLDTSTSFSTTTGGSASSVHISPTVQHALPTVPESGEAAPLSSISAPEFVTGLSLSQVESPSRKRRRGTESAIVRAEQAARIGEQTHDELASSRAPKTKAELQAENQRLRRTLEEKDAYVQQLQAMVSRGQSASPAQPQQPSSSEP